MRPYAHIITAEEMDELNKAILDAYAALDTGRTRVTRDYLFTALSLVAQMRGGK